VTGPIELSKAVQMTEAFTIGSEELAILCDFVGGWGAKWGTNNLETDKRQALDRLIANGFLEPAAHSITKYQHTAKTELLFAQLCVGISGG
jgi:exonuclease V gamma subunit